MATVSQISGVGEDVWILLPPYAVLEASEITSPENFDLVCHGTIYNTVSGSTSNGIIVSGACCEKNERIEDQRPV